MKKLLTVVCLYLAGIATTNAQSFTVKDVEYADIQGAYKFEQPIMLRDSEGDMLNVEKLGHGAAALYDWNNDGKLDLLFGEFSGKTDSFLKVYLNVGKKKHPELSSEWFYAQDSEGDNLVIPGY